MPLDPSIPLSVRPIQFADPLDQYAKVAQIKGLNDASQLSALQRRQLETNMAEHDKVLAVLNGMQPGETLESALPKIMAASPTTGATLAKTIAETQRAKAGTDKDNALAAASRIDMYRNALGPVNDQASFTPWRDNFVKEFPQFAQTVPTTFSLENKLALVRKGDELVKALTSKFEKVDTGGSVQFVDTNPNTNPNIGATNIQKTATPGEKMTDARARELNGILEGHKPVDISGTAEAIANYDVPLPPRPANMRNPLAAQRWDELFAAVKAKNPNYSVQDYAVSQKALKDFSTGQQGNSVRSFSVAISHLDTLQNLANALKNGDAQLINRLSNAWKEQTGQAAPTNFETAKQIVADEVVKAIVGSGSGALGDRESAAATIKRASSPEQLSGSISTYKELMNGQLKGLRRQYEETTKRKDFDRFLSDEAKAVVQGGGEAGKTQKSFNSLPDPNMFEGKTMKDEEHNIFYKSIGGRWVRQ